MSTHNLIVVLLAVFMSCKGIIDKSNTELCYDNGSSELVEKISFRDTERIKQLEGNFVEMEGIFRYRFEDVGLYPTKTAEPSEAMWVNISVPDDVPNEIFQSLDQKKVIIIGRVSLTDKGHFNSYNGTLDSVFCIKAK